MKKIVLFMFCALLMTGCGKKASSKDDILVDEIEFFDEETSSFEQLRNEVESFKQGLPMDLGSGLIAIDCQLLAKEVLYIYEMDEDYYELENTRETRQSMKALVAGSMQDEKGSSDFRKMLQLCVQSGRGLGYQYVGDQTGTTITIHFTDQELERLLDQDY